MAESPNCSSSLNTVLLAFDDGKPLHFAMKLLTLCLLVLFISLVPLAADAGGKHGTRITRNEAQHLALSSHPGARVTAAHLNDSGRHPVWLIELAGPDANQVVHLSVDGMSGRVFSQRYGSR